MCQHCKSDNHTAYVPYQDPGANGYVAYTAFSRDDVVVFDVRTSEGEYIPKDLTVEQATGILERLARAINHARPAGPPAVAEPEQEEFPPLQPVYVVPPITGLPGYDVRPFYGLVLGVSPDPEQFGSYIVLRGDGGQFWARPHEITKVLTRDMER